MIKLINSTFYKEKETKEKLIKYIRDADIMSISTKTFDFEKKFELKQKRKHAVFVSSGSTANLALIQALLNLGRIKKGDKVAFSTLTWATNLMPVIQLGLEPLPIDCEISHLNISLKALEETYAKTKFKVLFLTNVLGFSGHIDKIAEFCKAHKVILLEDNCESLGSKVKNKLLGNFGLASTFSTYVGHHISTIEGGMVCTDDAELHGMLVLVRAHGWDRNIPLKFKKQLMKKYKVDKFNSKYTFYDLAYNIRATDIQGFLGGIQIDYWDEIVSKRENNFKTFYKQILENNLIYPMDVSHMSLVSNFTVPVVFKKHADYLKYRARFVKNEVEIRPVIAGNMVKQPVFKKYIKKTYKTPISNIVHENGFYFANNPELSQSSINLISALLEK